MDLSVFRKLALVIYILKSINANLCKNQNPCGYYPCGWIAEWSAFICNCPNGKLALNKTCTYQECNPNPCYNGGTCSYINNKITCECSEGYGGTYCDKKFITVDSCELVSNPCLNKGHCKSIPNNYMCTCEPGFTGPKCEILILCDPQFCLNGNCVEKNGLLQCECKPGWNGPFCNNSLIGGCELNPRICRNGGSCINSFNGDLNFFCVCVQGYTGLFCEFPIEFGCSQLTCKNGFCFESPEGSYCKCLKGWSGDRCDIKADCNENSNCLNGGKCNNGICTCPEFFSGSLCEKILAPICIVNICSNGGTCYEMSDKIFCSCPDDFFGDYCELV